MNRAEEKITTLPEVNSDRWLSLEDLIGESWRPVVGYEDKYLVSNFGRVKSLERIQTKSDVSNAKWSQRKYPTKILKSHKNMYGYYMVYLSNRGSTNGQIINVWDKISLAAKTLKICPTSICNCISGLSKRAGGYIWKKE